MKQALRKLWPFSLWFFLLEQIMVLRKHLEICSAENLRLSRLAKENYVRVLVAEPRYADPRHLARFETKVFSQGGEDGVIQEIFRRLGTTSRRFLEIGVGDNLENNTCYLLAQGWQGTWVDCLPAEQIAAAPGLAGYLQGGRLQYVRAMVGPENIREVLEPHLSVQPVDLFSLDIDRSTYQVWSAMKFLRPRVLVLEYNAFFPPPIAWTMPSGRDPLDSSTISFGASLRSLHDLARERGYELVHCSLSGVNAFFVDRTLIDEQFYRPDDPLSFYEPYRSFLLFDHELRRSL